MPDANHEDVRKDIDALYHPVRYRVWSEIEAHQDELYLSSLAEKLELDKQLVAFHLLTLTEGGFIDGDFKVVQTPHSKGRAAKVFHTTPKLRATLEAAKKEIEAKLSTLKGSA